jgi:hypothetical protein
MNLHLIEKTLEEIRDLLIERQGRGQLPGCLPPGADLDTLLTREEFCIWQRRGRNWFAAWRRRLPGVIVHSKKNIRIHPRTYLDKAIGMK